MSRRYAVILYPDDRPVEVIYHDDDYDLAATLIERGVEGPVVELTLRHFDHEVGTVLFNPDIRLPENHSARRVVLMLTEVHLIVHGIAGFRDLSEGSIEEILRLVYDQKT